MDNNIWLHSVDGQFTPRRVVTEWTINYPTTVGVTLRSTKPEISAKFAKTQQYRLYSVKFDANSENLYVLICKIQIRPLSPALFQVGCRKLGFRFWLIQWTRPRSSERSIMERLFVQNRISTPADTLARIAAFSAEKCLCVCAVFSFPDPFRYTFIHYS